jgi:hypothetical protein
MNQFRLCHWVAGFPCILNLFKSSEILHTFGAAQTGRTGNKGSLKPMTDIFLYPNLVRLKHLDPARNILPPALSPGPVRDVDIDRVLTALPPPFSQRHVENHLNIEIPPHRDRRAI